MTAHTLIPQFPASRKSIAIWLVVALVVLATLAEAAVTITVTQRGRTFGIKKLSIAAGSIVRILNDDDFTHHAVVKDPDFKFDSGEIERGQHVDIKFDKAGKFAVRCAIHPKMRLRVTVK